MILTSTKEETAAYYTRLKSHKKQMFHKEVVSEKGPCKFCGSKDKLEACHVYPRSWIKNKKKDFDKNNLIVLCRPCHVSFDRFVGVVGRPKKNVDQ